LKLKNGGNTFASAFNKQTYLRYRKWSALLSVVPKKNCMRKRRTREHIIEDLSFNHVERQILYAGYVFYRYSQNDYGYDGSITTFNEQGEIENLVMHCQLKATDKLKIASDRTAYTFDVSKRDLELWLQNPVVVLFLLYDAQKEVAYYLDLQDYFLKDGILLEKIRKFVRIYIPFGNIWNRQAIIELRHLKNQLLDGTI
jgi:hypothetical protein